MKSVKQILASKPAEVFAVGPQTTVFEALEEMMNKNISALVVMEDSVLKGIFTERDYARKIILKGKSSKDTLIADAMTSQVITISPEDSIEYCMNIMTERHIRHLPVVNNGTVCGMVSIGDVVKSIIEVQKSTIEHLQSYIHSY